MKFCFGDIVVIEDYLIGVVVKCLINNKGNNYDVYVRMRNKIINYDENDIQRYMVRHKYLDEEELEYQYNAVNGQ
jgi:DNA-binding MltR family transcriptional regulator